MRGDFCPNECLVALKVRNVGPNRQDFKSVDAAESGHKRVMDVFANSTSNVGLHFKLDRVFHLILSARGISGRSPRDIALRSPQRNEEKQDAGFGLRLSDFACLLVVLAYHHVIPTRTTTVIALIHAGMAESHKSWRIDSRLYPHGACATSSLASPSPNIPGLFASGT
jgi:hypothetical protein